MTCIEHLIPISSDVSLHTLISTPPSPTIKPTLLLLHFWGGSNNTYKPLISHLQNDYPIIAPSLRGWDASSKPTDPGSYSIKDYASDMISLIQHVQQKQAELLSNGIVLVGHSMGGKIAQYLLTYPFIRELTKGVILVAPAPAGYFSLPDEMREQQIHAYDSEESAEYVIRNVLLSRPDAVDDEIVARLVEDAVSGSDGARHAWPVNGMGEDYEGEVEEGVTGYENERGGKLRAMVMVGGMDRIETPENVQERTVGMLSRAGADVTVHLLEGTGHLSPVEAPERIAGIVKHFV